MFKNTNQVGPCHVYFYINEGLLLSVQGRPQGAIDQYLSALYKAVDCFPFFPHLCSYKINLHML